MNLDFFAITMQRDREAAHPTPRTTARPQGHGSTPDRASNHEPQADRNPKH
jgi:hypothetical protein